MGLYNVLEALCGILNVIRWLDRMSMGATFMLRYNVDMFVLSSVTGSIICIIHRGSVGRA